MREGPRIGWKTDDAALQRRMAESVDPRELFQRVKGLWPQSVVFGDDPLVVLNAIFWPLEERLGNDDDEWLSLGAWAFHQGIHEMAEVVAANSESTVSPREMRFSTFDRWIRFNLEGDNSWAEELAEWLSKRERSAVR